MDRDSCLCPLTDGFIFFFCRSLIENLITERYIVVSSQSKSCVVDDFFTDPLEKVAPDPSTAINCIE